MDDWWSQLFDFSDYGALIVLLQNSILAGAVLGIIGGLIGVSFGWQSGQRSSSPWMSPMTVPSPAATSTIGARR